MKGRFPEQNLSPRKPGSSNTLAEFTKLRISVPPGLKCPKSEPKPAAAAAAAADALATATGPDTSPGIYPRPVLKRKSVVPSIKAGGIGGLSESIYARELDHSRSYGRAQTIGVNPSLHRKIESDVVVLVQAADPKNKPPSEETSESSQPAQLARPPGLQTKAPSAAVSSTALRYSDLQNSQYTTQSTTITPPRYSGLPTSQSAPHSATTAARCPSGLQTTQYASTPTTTAAPADSAPLTSPRAKVLGIQPFQPPRRRN